MSNSQNLRLLSKKYTFFKKNHTVLMFELFKNITLFINPWKLIYKSELILILQIIEQTMSNSQYLLF